MFHFLVCHLSKVSRTPQTSKLELFSGSLNVCTKAFEMLEKIRRDAAKS